MDESKELVQRDSDDIVREQSSDIANQIVQESDAEEIKKLTTMFNLLQQKKNVLRILKFNGLLDTIGDQMEKRFEKRSDEFSNADLLNYMQAIQTALDKSSTQLKQIDDIPAIQFNQQNNINVSVVDELDRESRERVAEVIKSIMQGAQKEDIIIENSDIEENGDKE